MGFSSRGGYSGKSDFLFYLKTCHFMENKPKTCSLTKRRSGTNCWCDQSSLTLFLWIYKKIKLTRICLFLSNDSRPFLPSWKSSLISKNFSLERKNYRKQQVYTVGPEKFHSIWILPICYLSSEFSCIIHGNWFTTNEINDLSNGLLQYILLGFVLH